MIYRAQFEQWVAAPVEELFLFFANPANLTRIMPPSTGTELLRVKLVAPPGARTDEATVTDLQPLAGAGSEIVTSFRIFPFLPFRAQWIAVITEFEWNHHFADVQRKGPFRSFQHRHEFLAEERDGVRGTRVRDSIEYDIGFGFLGTLAQGLFVRRELRNTFLFRQEAVTRIWSGRTT
jgi:ligand-binding SRPBCC domain-containing protein